MSISALPESVPYEDADARLGGALSAWFEGAGAAPGYRRVLFFDGDLTLAGDFLDAVNALRGEAGADPVELVVVAGDLTVDGPIALYGDRPGLYVDGRTRAETLEAGDCEIYLRDGAFTHLLYGWYNHGRLRTGVVETPWVIDDDHPMDVCAPGALWVDNHGDDETADYSVDGSPGVADAFVPEVVDPEDGDLLIDEFLDRLRAGLPVLLPAAGTPAESVAESVAAEVARALADRTEHLDLTGRGLQAFPTGVLQLPWLRTLVLDGNPIGALPESLGMLTRLEHLSVRDCRLTTLPESVGDLTGLRVLRVAGNRGWDRDAAEFTLPAGIGRLTALEELDVSRLSVPAGPWRKLPEMTRFTLPDAFGDLVSLRKLTADETNIVFPATAHGLTGVEELSLACGAHRYLRAVPEAVSTFPNLRRLDLSGNYFDAIPDGLLRLTRLEELDLSGSLGLVRTPLPDLGRLPALRVLGFGGGVDDTHAPEPARLRELFGMALTGLEELRISWWHRDGGGYRPEPDHFAGIGRFRRLRTVDLSCNALRDLPAEFDTLPDLVAVDLRFNVLSKTNRARIAAAHPGARIRFEP